MKSGRHQQRAVILGRVNYGEADLIVSFLTRDLGKISGIAKHGRKSRKRFGNVISPGALVELTFTVKTGRELVILESGELVRAFENLAQDVTLLARAGLALELTEAFCAAQDPAENIFQLLNWGLDRFDRHARPEEAMFLFLLKMLQLSGFGPNVSTCPVCGKKVEPGRPGSLKCEPGGLVCDDCSPGGFTASPGTIRMMALVQSLGPDKMDRPRVGEQVLREAGPFLMSFIRGLLGRDLKAACFLEKIEGDRAARPSGI
ncbi:MAG: DNA repair protein RecO [Pseudomonadota bacterium]